jgi:hypothetical protein
MLDAEAIKAKLPDIAGIEQLAITIVGDRAVAAFNGLTTSVAHNASEDQIIAAIRNAASLRASMLRAPNETAPELSPQPLPTKGPAMNSFAASLKAVLDEAKANVARAQVEGVAKVKEAAGRLNDAAAQTARVADTMAGQIHDQADAVLAELGQISNMPPAE